MDQSEVSLTLQSRCAFSRCGQTLRGDQRDQTHSSLSFWGCFPVTRAGAWGGQTSGGGCETNQCHSAIASGHGFHDVTSTFRRKSECNTRQSFNHRAKSIWSQVEAWFRRERFRSGQLLLLGFRPSPFDGTQSLLCSVPSTFQRYDDVVQRGDQD